MATETSEKKTRVDRLQEARGAEAKANVSVIDAADGQKKCQTCKGDGLIFYVHLFRDPNRPIFALCKNCTIARAGGAEHVYVKEIVWLRKFWKSNRREAKRELSESHQRALKEARMTRGKGGAAEARC